MHIFFICLLPIDNNLHSLHRAGKECHLGLGQEVAIGIPYQGSAETRTGPTTCLFCRSDMPRAV